MIRADVRQEKRKERNRFRLRQKSGGRLRLSVFRSKRHIYAQIVDDEGHKTLVAASSQEKSLRDKPHAGCDMAGHVGKLVAERARKSKIDHVVFDRGGYLYHGRVKALAEGARSAGLSF